MTRLVLALFALVCSFALIWWLTTFYMALGWVLVILTLLLVWAVSRDDRERQRREERELTERIFRSKPSPWDTLPDRCHEAPDPYRKEAA